MAIYLSKKAMLKQVGVAAKLDDSVKEMFEKGMLGANLDFEKILTQYSRIIDACKKECKKNGGNLVEMAKSKVSGDSSKHLIGLFATAVEKRKDVGGALLRRTSTEDIRNLLWSEIEDAKMNHLQGEKLMDMFKSGAIKMEDCLDLTEVRKMFKKAHRKCKEGDDPRDMVPEEYRELMGLYQDAITGPDGKERKGRDRTYRINELFEGVEDAKDEYSITGNVDDFVYKHISHGFQADTAKHLAPRLHRNETYKKSELNFENFQEEIARGNKTQRKQDRNWRAADKQFEAGKRTLGAPGRTSEEEVDDKKDPKKADSSQLVSLYLRFKEEAARNSTPEERSSGKQDEKSQWKRFTAYILRLQSSPSTVKNLYAERLEEKDRTKLPSAAEKSARERRERALDELENADKASQIGPEGVLEIETIMREVAATEKPGGGRFSAAELSSIRSELFEAKAARTMPTAAQMAAVPMEEKKAGILDLLTSGAAPKTLSGVKIGTAASTVNSSGTQTKTKEEKFDDFLAAVDSFKPDGTRKEEPAAAQTAPTATQSQRIVRPAPAFRAQVTRPHTVPPKVAAAAYMNTPKPQAAPTQAAPTQPAPVQAAPTQVAPTQPATVRATPAPQTLEDITDAQQPAGVFKLVDVLKDVKLKHPSGASFSPEEVNGVFSFLNMFYKSMNMGGAEPMPAQ